MVSNMGRPKDEEIQEFFVGLESQFEGIVSAKQVLTKREGDSERGRLQGVLLTFQSEAALAKFTEQEELKYKGLLLKWTLMTEVLKVGFFIIITCSPVSGMNAYLDFSESGGQKQEDELCCR